MFQGTGFSSASTSSPFGQTPFGKPATTGFNAPVFGSGTSLFGASTTQQSNLFGSTATPAFGQAQTTQPTFGSFTSTSAGGTTGLFGSQGSAANSGGLFGSNTTSAFGQAKPSAFGGFGSTGTAAPTPQPTTTSLFGQPQAQSASGIFGSSTGFGAAAGGTTVKFTPLTGTDTMIKNGVTTNINTRHHCITCMKEYESKSLEELRLEDYAANRKGPRQGTQTGSVFGTTGQISLFGPSTSAGGATSNIFGASGDNKPLLGNTSNTTGFATSGTVFGSTSTNIFGKPAGTATAFGTPAPTTTGSFGFNTTANTNPFGANTGQKPFGGPTPQSGGLFGTTSQSSTGFGTNTTTGFGTFGTTQSSLFGEQKPTFGLGTNTGFSLPQPSTATATPLFGGQKQTLGSNFGGGGFVQPATTSTAPVGFGTSFGQQQQSGGLLGGASSGLKTTSTGFTFGQPTNTLGNLTLGSGGSLFGQQNQKPGGLFGTTTMGSTGQFGASSMSSFGANTMFNTGSNTLGSGVGSNTLGTGGGLAPLGTLAGLSQQSQLGSGAVPAQFVNPIQQYLKTLIAVPYGDRPILKNVLKESTGAKLDEFLKPTGPAAQKALMSGKNYKLCSSKTTTKLKIKPIEPSNLSKKALFEEMDREDEIFSTNGSSGNRQQWPVKSSWRRLLIKPKCYDDSSTISPLVTTHQRRATVDPNKDHFTNNPPIVTTSTSGDNATSNIDVTAVAPPLKNMFSTGTTSTPQSTLKQPLPTDSNTSPISPLSPVAPAFQKKVLFKNVSSDISGNNSSIVLKQSADHSTTSSSDSDQEDSVTAELDRSSSGVGGHPTGISLRRAGYYTIPSLDELASLIDDQGRCIVDNFTVGRLNYGNIFYPESFDVCGLNLDEIVHFRHKEVTVYPNDAVKPPVGEGLNRRAQVTLDRVWPVDKTTRLPITDPVRLLAMDYESKLSRACAKHGTNYVEYRPTTGSWVFKVNHFSKYGLTDSDEDDTSAVDIKKIKLATQQTGSKAVIGITPPLIQEQQQHTVPQLHIPPKQVEDALTALMAEEDEDMDDGITSPFDLDDELERRALSPTAKLAKETGTSANKLQLMKASFFERTNFNIDGEGLMVGGGEDVDMYGHDLKLNSFKRLTDTLSWYQRQGAAHLLNLNHLPEPETRINNDEFMGLERITSLEEQATQEDDVGDAVIKISHDLPTKVYPCVRPKIYELHFLGCEEEIRPRQCDAQTEDNFSTKYVADLGFFKRFINRVSTAPCNQYFTLKSVTRKDSTEGDIITQNPLISSIALNRFVSVISTAPQLSTAPYKIIFQEGIERHLEAALRESILEQTNNGPKFSPRSGLGGLEAHYLIADEIAKNSEDSYCILAKRVFGLMHALWATHDGMKECDTGGNDHACLMFRKTALSEWLECSLADNLLQRADSTQVHNTVFACMAGFKLAEACERCREISDLQLSLLLSQAGSSRATREIVRRQLIQWRETESDRYISIDRLKCYLLLAGLPIHQSSKEFINTCEQLDWLTSFAIHLWYVNSTNSSVTDALYAYDEAYSGENKYAVPPLPSYSKEFEIQFSKPSNYRDNNKEPWNDVGQVYDILYHLLHLFSEKSYPLERILNPSTHTPDLLDYRIVWLVMRILTSMGYSHLSDHAALVIHKSFADQLETYGLWDWAVFVLLHIRDGASREFAVKQMIGRFISVEEKCPKEMFLIQRLSIPENWIYEAKSAKAIFLQRYNDAAKYLIKAGKWDKCHKLICDHILSKAIINGRYEYLEELLEELSKRSHLVSGWSCGGGGTILEYLKVVRKLEELILGRDPNGLAHHLQDLQPQLTRLCHNFKLMPCRSPIDRLAQCEISRRMADLIQNLIADSLRVGAEDVRVEDCVERSLLLARVDLLTSLISELPLSSEHKRDQWLRVMNLWGRGLLL